MQLRNSLRKKVPANKRLNFSAMLSNDYFSNNIIQIQMALNKNRVLPLDYLIRRTKSKINSGITLKPKKTEDDLFSESYRNTHLDKRKIPEELEKILNENAQKFWVQSQEYLNLKNENDKSLGYWHYVQEMGKKKKQEIFAKKYQISENKNDINLYSDKIQKLSETMFRLNPLLITKEKIDIFFYYLGEFNKYFFNKKKYEHIKKKVVNFLKNLKDFLDYVEIKADSNIDAIGKEIKLQNSKFIKGLNNKIKAELKSMKIKQRMLDNIEIKSAKKMIRKTKKTLESIHKDKNFFEDPIYFDRNYINFNSNKKNFELKSRNKIKKNINQFNLSAPNFAKNINMNQTIKMSTASTGFFLNEKNNKKKIYKIKPKAESCKNREDIIIEDSNLNFKKIKLNQKLMNKRITSALNFPNNKIILKANTIKSKKSINISENKKNSEKEKEKESISSSFYNNNIEQTRAKKLLYNNNLNLNRKNSINSLKHIGIENNKNSNFVLSPENNIMAKSGETPMVKINKHILKKKTFNIQTNNYLKFNNNTKPRGKRQRSSIASSNTLLTKNRNSNDFSSNDKSKTKSKLHLSTLYEDLKSKPKLNYFEINDINSYFVQNGKKVRNNLKLLEIIIQAKRTMHKYDIDQKTKKVSQMNLNSEQISKLNDLKEINGQIEALDLFYMNNIFDFKSRTMCENNEIKT